MSKKLKELVLKDSEWDRGHGAGYLRNSNGTKCCLGVLGKACGARGITDRGMPNEAPSRKWPEGLLYGEGEEAINTPLACEIAMINDQETITDKERLKRLRPLFRNLGYKLVFDPNA